MMIIPQSFLKQFLTGLAVLSLITIAGCDQPETEAPPVRPVLAMKVGDVSSMGGRVFPGRAQAIQSANLAFEVSGSLAKRPVKVGDRVKTGQLLARLDPRDYQSKLKAAQAELNKNKANFKRGQELIKDHHISEFDFDTLKAAYEVARANLETARKALSDTELKAPFDGRIAELFVKNFQAVQAKEQIVRLVNTDKVEMEIHIPEVLISLVPKVKSVLVRFDTYPDQDIKATITEIGAEASKTTRTYPVTLVMEQPKDFTILPGMAGEVRADPTQLSEEIKKQNRGFTVPLAAVFSPDASNDSFVWVVDEQAGSISRRAVTTGELKSTGVIIKDGLSVGEWIAIAGAHKLREGQKVRLLPAQGE